MYYKGKSLDDLVLIASDIASSVSKENTSDIKNVKKQLLENKDKLILFPITDGRHYILLYRRPNKEQWGYMDSKVGSTKAFAFEVIEKLMDTYREPYHMITPEQTGSFECGTYVLLFMLVVATFDDNELEQGFLDKLAESNRISLVTRIKKLYDMRYTTDDKLTNPAVIILYNTETTGFPTLEKIRQNFPRFHWESDNENNRYKKGLRIIATDEDNYDRYRSKCNRSI